MSNLLGLRRLIAPLVLVAVVAVCYQAAPDNAFHLDDEFNIVRHPPILMTDLTLENLVHAGQNAFLPRRPLPSMTFAFDWWLGGGSPRPFQYTNLVIHGATALAVYSLFILVLGRANWPIGTVRVAALAGTALWACHPIQVQAVTYIVQRMASMAALFTILTVVFYILGRDCGKAHRRWVFFCLSGLSWALGLVSKETAAVAPILVLMAEFGVIRHGGPIIRRKVDWIMLWLPVLVAVLVVIDIASGAGPLSARFLPGYENREFTLIERLLTQPRVIFFHLSQIVWPMPGRFSLEHDFALSTGFFSPAMTLGALLGLAAWCALGVRALLRESSRILGFFMLWFPATLAIESTFIPLEIVFEHRMYLPSVGLAGIAAFAFSSGLSRGVGYRVAIVAGCVVVVCLLIISTGMRVPDWRSPVSLAKASVQAAPNSARAWSTLANALKEAGQGWEAITPPMMKALAIDPDQPVASNLYAIRLIELRRLDEAERVLESLMTRAKRDHSIFNTLGMLRLGQGNYSGAIEQFGKAISLNPYVPEFRYNLALSYELALMCTEAHAKWLSYLQYATHEDRKVAVQARLQRNFEMEGGRCFGWDR